MSRVTGKVKSSEIHMDGKCVYQALDDFVLVDLPSGAT
jgi:hypothetical protein